MAFGTKFKGAGSGGFGKKKRSGSQGNKFNNTRVERHGLTFDSLLEVYVWEKLTQYGVKFNFQHFLTLQEAFKNPSGETVRKLKWVCDFVIPIGDKEVYLDAKGKMTNEAKIKAKLAQWILTQRGINYEIKFVTGDIGKPKTLSPIANYCVYLSKLQKEHGTGKFEFIDPRRQSKTKEDME